MAHWKLTLAYDGTSFHGWQIQPSLVTIQGTIAAALHHLTGETVLPQGSGRTDSGVHALAQVASFTLQAAIPATNLLRALNRALPSSIRVLHAEEVAEDFHARHSVLRKTYEYRIFPGAADARGGPARICPPFLAPYAWDCPWPFDLALAREAAAQVIGEHDFTSFAASDPDLRTRTESSAVQTSKATPSEVLDPSAQPESSASGICSVGCSTRKELRLPLSTRTIFESVWTEENGLAIYRVTGSGFLHHMVRNLVGTFVDAAARRISPHDVPTILAARDRSAAGPTAPARGLFLVNVQYATDPGINPGAPCLDSETWEEPTVQA